MGCMNEKRLPLSNLKSRYVVNPVYSTNIEGRGTLIAPEECIRTERSKEAERLIWPYPQYTYFIH